MEKYAVHCGNCRKKLTFGAKLLGKAIDCPNCKAVIAIPLSMKPMAPKVEAVTVNSGAPIPTFQPVARPSDSIFDVPPPGSVLDAPTPKPMVPTEPLPANPFAFDTGADASPSVEITAEANPFGFAEANPASADAAEPVKSKAKPSTAKAGRSKSVVEIDNPFGAAETLPDAKPEPVPEAPAASKTYGQPKPAKPKAPIITWIFLAWAVLATGAAIFFATRNPAPVTPMPVQEKAAPAKEPEKKADKPSERKVERKSEKKPEKAPEKKTDKDAERKDGKSAMEKEEMKK